MEKNVLSNASSSCDKRNLPLLSVHSVESPSWEETLHLTRRPANAARLKEAVDELDKGGGTERKLAE